MYDNKPLVSIRLMTYNHETFIKDALDGIFRQKVNFNVEVVVGDDYSTDNTLSIVKSYRDTENIKIRVLDRSSNSSYRKNREQFGRLYNFVDILLHCRGKFIALLDGDDYWTDDNKLQLQIDYLSINPDCMICGHLVEIRKNEKNMPLPQVGDIIYRQQDLAQENYLRTATVVFRNVFSKIPEIIYNYPVADWFIYMLLLQKGYAYVMDKRMAIYRMHDYNVWSRIEEKDRIIISLKVYELFKRDFPHLKSYLEYYFQSKTEYLRNIIDNRTIFKRIRYKLRTFFNLQ